MKKSIRKITDVSICFLFVCLFLSLTKTSVAQHTVSLKRNNETLSQINWITFEQLSDSLTYNPGKKILISFHAEWCVYCRKMANEVYTKPEIIQLINQQYYAVSFDAEYTESVHFDGQEFVNNQQTRRRKGFHELALLLAGRNGQVTLPATLILDAEFNVLSRHFEYLSPQKLISLLD